MGLGGGKGGEFWGLLATALKGFLFLCSRWVPPTNCVKEDVLLLMTNLPKSCLHGYITQNAHVSSKPVV